MGEGRGYWRYVPTESGSRFITGYDYAGHGTMDEVRRGSWWTVPFLQIGKILNILIPHV